jgi:hypothetical protein
VGEVVSKTVEPIVSGLPELGVPVFSPVHSSWVSCTTSPKSAYTSFSLKCEPYYTGIVAFTSAIVMTRSDMSGLRTDYRRYHELVHLDCYDSELIKERYS